MSFDKVGIGDVILYHGDCREVLPHIKNIDAIVTDPPYGLGNKMSGGTWGSAEKYAVMRKWDQIAPSDVIHTILNMEVPSVIWGGNNFPVPESRCWLVWNKKNALRTMADHELAWTNFDQPGKGKSLPVGRHKHGHPTEKPLPLMEWSLTFLQDSENICDPFMGSGTTGFACVSMGKKFIGIEQEKEYFDISCKRIEEAQKQERLFV